jgi:O-antigen/teichoic acid export membrane protein
VLQNILRLDLKFELIALGEIIAAVGLLAGIPAAIWFGLPGVAVGGYALSSALSLGAVYFLVQAKFRHVDLWDFNWTKKLLTTAPAFIVTSALGLGFYQMTRLALGGFHVPGGKIAAFFAAEGVITIALLPANYFGAIIYTLVARKQSLQEIKTSLLLQHLASCIACSGFVYVGICIFGRLLLTFFYNSVAEEASAILRITSVGSMFTSLLIFSRGILYRFCNFKRIIAYSALGFLTLASALFATIPGHGVIGAAWALAISNIFVGLLWFGTYIRMVVKSRRSPAEVRAPDVSDVLRAGS